MSFLPALLSFAFFSFATLAASQYNNGTSGNGTSPSTYKFYNNNTAPFLIETLPLVDFPVGELYSGNVVINESDPDRTLFFVFKPATGPNAAPKTTTIWLNGGAGCSSLVGFFQENGPILWQPGTLGPVSNLYSWDTLTNMLWVEYPVGTGFTTGLITAFDEVDISRDFVGFYENWQKLFGIKDYKTYITGESYAGRYVPYIVAEMLKQNDTAYFDVAGTLIYSGIIGMYTEVGETIPTAAFAREHKQFLGLNEFFLETLDGVADECGHTQYLDKYLQFPPPGQQPVVTLNPDEDCDTYSLLIDAVGTLNPCRNPYDISASCPVPYDPLGQVIGNIPTAYFNRTDVRQAIHAPTNFKHDVGNITQANQVWFECVVSLNYPFLTSPDGQRGPEGQQDLSPDPIQNVLPRVIEATNRTILVHGDLDTVAPVTGALLAVQNMTWAGELGFQQAPLEDFIVPEQGLLGKKHLERGLMFVNQSLTTHLGPQSQPRAALRHLQWMLGQIEDL